jgi:DNA repair exonuclease SbcCD nuclease subunit
MPKIAFVTDNHFDKHSRFEETVRIHNWIADDAAARGCELTLLGGDAFEGKSCAEERDAFAAWLLRMAKLGHVIGIYGNHELADELEIFSKLDSAHPITFYSRPAVHVAAGSVMIACLPWPRKSTLLAEAGTGGLEAVNNLAQHHLRNILRGLGSEMDQESDGSMPRIALAHVMIDGAKTDHDQPLVGADMALSLQDLGLMRAHVYACGHVHAQQDETIDGAPCFYGGAPRHNNFGEPGPKGYVVIEFDDAGKLVSWERISTPATPMLLVSADWKGGHLTTCSGLQLDGAEIRLRVRVPADERVAARSAAEEWRFAALESGAFSVRIEEDVVVTKRARAPQVAAAISISDKLRAHWGSINFDPGTRESSLLSKATELHDEQRRAS